MTKILARVTRNKFPYKTSFPLKPVSLRNQLSRETSFSAKPASLRNQYWMQKLIKFLMEKSFLSYWRVLKKSYTHIFTAILFRSNVLRAKTNFKSDRLFGFYWSVLGKFFFLQKPIFDSIETNLVPVTSFYFSFKVKTFLTLKYYF